MVASQAEAGSRLPTMPTGMRDGCVGVDPVFSGTWTHSVYSKANATVLPRVQKGLGSSFQERRLGRRSRNAPSCPSCQVLPSSAPRRATRRGRTLWTLFPLSPSSRLCTVLILQIQVNIAFG